MGDGRRQTGENGVFDNTSARLRVAPTDTAEQQRLCEGN